MKYGSVCSGIEAATVAWHPLGWSAAWFAEIDKFPSAVLAHHYPSVPNLGDMTKITQDAYANQHPIDLLVGGTPCQSFSVAGLRKGLDDPRGNLMLTYLGIADHFKPRWTCWENVPGVLSSGGGRDFGTFLGALGELGYGWAYRVLDAQHFGVPQRRRRVFVVGYLGDWRRAAAVLFERESLLGHPAPGRSKGQTTTGGTARSVALRGREGGATAELGDDVAHTLRASGGGGDKAHALVASTNHYDIAPCIGASGRGFSRTGDTRGQDCVVAFSCKDYGVDVGEMSPTLRAMGHSGSHANAGGQVAVQQSAQVRRLTPKECARLQGFPDDYLDIPYRGKPAADGPKYKALGNSFAVPVVRWIGQRIALVDQIALDISKAA